MKTIVVASLLVALAAGCGKTDENVPTLASGTIEASVLDLTLGGSENPNPAPDALELAAVAESAETEAEDLGRRKLTEEDVSMLNYAVYRYREQFGRLPGNLQEMVGTPHLRRVPAGAPGQKLAYDASTGTVKLEGQ